MPFQDVPPGQFAEPKKLNGIVQLCDEFCRTGATEIASLSERELRLAERDGYNGDRLAAGCENHYYSS